MRIQRNLLLALTLLAAGAGYAQTVDDGKDAESEQLKLAALGALVAAPDERALPILVKVIDGNNSDEVKSRALFVLGQIDAPEARAQLLDVAQHGDERLRPEAVRMIGIGGNAEALASLSGLYASGDEAMRHAVLDAYLIAGDSKSVYEIAASAKSPQELEAAVNTLGAMGAQDELRKLRQAAGVSDALIQALAVSGDAASLRELAADTSDPDRQVRAITALGVVGGDEGDATLVDIYRGASTDGIRRAALQGLVVAGGDQQILALYKASNDNSEKRRLLHALGATGSDLMLPVIDAALTENQ
ncbi:MAG: HEAT repeat domain-containing protein [Woeseiaceae bacterium]